MRAPILDGIFLHTSTYAMQGLALYVARDKRRPDRHDLGSVLCLRVLDLMPAGAVEVHDADALRARPLWLTGTPTLVLDGGDVLGGYEALTHLQRLAVDLARSSSRPAKRAPQQQAPPPPMAAAVAAVEEDALWGSSSVVEDDDDGATQDRKLTGDDLARAMRAREEARAPPAGGSAPPPLPPMSD